MHDPGIDRRHLLAGGLSLCGGLALSSRAVAAALGQARPGRRVVLLQLSGGNDGLSTVVPWADDAYRRARASTAVDADEVLRIDDYRGLHPGLARLRGLWDRGRLALVEGAGYPGATRSHFKSLEIWHTARLGGRNAGEGWLGRASAAAWSEPAPPELVVHVGRHAPYSVHSSSRPAVSLESPTSYDWFGRRAEREVYAMAGEELSAGAAATPRNSGRDAALRRLRGLLDDARDSSTRIRRAAAVYHPSVEYPRTPFGATLRDVAALIHGDLGTRVVSTTLGGFDTHASQRGRHDGLMATLDAGLGAFVEDLGNSEAGRDVVVLVFSEFGRRVAENASRGTDHGKAGPMFLLGHGLEGGLYGEHPSLEQLDDGDVAFTTDFRRVYASVIEGWLGVDHEVVLGEAYETLPLFG